MVLHLFAVGMVVSGLMVHVYMGAVFPEEKPAFYSMITGVVDELYAYRHHFKWWRTVKVQQQLWRDGLRSTAPEEPSTKEEPGRGPCADEAVR